MGISTQVHIAYPQHSHPTHSPHSQGFSVLLYGFGSKRRLLDAFLRSRPPQQAVIAVDGRAPGLTARQVLLKAAHEQGRSSMAQLRYAPTHTPHCQPTASCDVPGPSRTKSCLKACALPLQTAA